LKELKEVVVEVDSFRRLLEGKCKYVSSSTSSSLESLSSSKIKKKKDKLLVPL
jgi:hypothetical protein